MTVPSTREVLADYVWMRTDNLTTAEEQEEIELEFENWLDSVKIETIRTLLNLFPGKTNAWVRDRLKAHIAALEDNGPYRADSR